MANLNEVTLSAVAVGGSVKEDLIDKIFDASPIDGLMQDSIGSRSSKNNSVEWTRESLTAANPDNARIDGSDSTGNDTVTGERLSNYHQILSKIVKVSDRGNDVDTVGAQKELAKQLLKRGKEIRRDLSSALVSENVAVAGDGASVAGKMAGLGAYAGTVKNGEATTSRGITTGADPVLSGNPGGYPTTAAVAGVKRALSKADVDGVISALYNNGADSTVFRSMPVVAGAFSTFLFDSTAQVATMQKDVMGTGNLAGGETVTAQGAVNVYVSNFATLEIIPDRYMTETATGVASAFIYQPDILEVSYLHQPTIRDLARTGLADNKEITLDASLVVETPECLGVIADIDTALVATA